jgi:TetR/AcrR family transcriptional regulator, cholesterol catabolism regulator
VTKTTEHKEHDVKPGVRAQRRDDMRRRLFRVASQLFAQSGFDATTYDDIAREAGVARQTVFNHFPRKEDFAFEWGAGNRSHLEALVTSSEFASETATNRLLMIVQTMAVIYNESAAEARVLLQAWVKAGGPIVEDPTLLGKQFQAIIETGQSTGEFHPELNAQTAAELFRAAYLDSLFRWVAADPTDPASDLLASMIARLEVILTGLRVPPLAALPYPARYGGIAPHLLSPDGPE